MEELFTTYTCKHCGTTFIKEDWENEDFKEFLCAHVQMEHKEVFDKLQDLETSCMITEVYVKAVETL